MILDISDAAFKRLFSDEKLYLPIRWDGNDFFLTLTELFSYYLKKLEKLPNESGFYSGLTRIETKEIKKVCRLLTKTVESYLNGFPSDAYKLFKNAMQIFMKQPLKVYEKSVTEQFKTFNNRYDRDESLKLFRVTSVVDNKPYKRERIFHTPYSLRAKVSTSRYSIAGYPSLYLGTSLELCCEEVQMNPYQGFALASVFKFEKTPEYSDTKIQVIELGVKPQDFIKENRENEISERRIATSLLENTHTRSAYLRWYPLIAACSYIRINKADPFAAEYIIPQLLMQWIRSEISKPQDDKYERLIGIRYFSCASIRASDMGFNYVFPTSGQQKYPNSPFCPVLAKSFYLSSPAYIHEYKSVRECERYLRSLKNFNFVGN